MQRLASHPAVSAAIAAELRALPPLEHPLEMIRAEEQLKAAKTELMEQLDEYVPPEMQDIGDFSLCKKPVFTPQGVAHNLTTLNAHWDAETKINVQRIRDHKDVQSTTCPRTRIPLQRDELITSGAEYDALSAIFRHANTVRDSLILQINTMQAVSLQSSLMDYSKLI